MLEPSSPLAQGSKCFVTALKLTQKTCVTSTPVLKSEPNHCSIIGFEDDDSFMKDIDQLPGLVKSPTVQGFTSSVDLFIEDGELKRESSETMEIDSKRSKKHGESPKTGRLGSFHRKSVSPIVNTAFKSPILGRSTEDKFSSFTSQIKHRLKNNSFNRLPMTTLVENRAALLQQALDAEQVLQNQISPSAVGPFHGLPSRVKFLLKTFRGIEELYDWQNECLKLPAVTQRQNLIYTLPTSGGKTLVAEILMMKELLCHGKDAIFVLPFVSLVHEKLRSLTPFAVELDFVVAEYAGSRGTFPPRKRHRRHTIYVCTIEKAHMLLNSLIDTDRLNEIGIVIADEMHMIGEVGGRGATFESLLSKVLYLPNDIQIIGMSATLSNMKDLKAFLRADVYERNFRPVELREYVKVNNKLYEFQAASDTEPVLIRELKFDDYTTEMNQKDPDMIAGLVMEVAPLNSCLIFCPTKKHCENIASMLAEVLPRSFLKHKQEEKLALYSLFTSEVDGRVCSVLQRTLKFGVAYHHSGLTSDERKLIEEAYIAGTLCCLTCTSTLAAGVNLPAKRVILRAPYIANDFISFSKYKQMVGRAGRAGIDSSGESILMIKPGEAQKVSSLLTGSADACKSSLLLEHNRTQMLVLSLIGTRIATSLKQIQEFMSSTLASVQCEDVDGISKLCADTTNLLVEWGLIEPCGMSFQITKLGNASFKGGVEPSNARQLYDMLKKGLQAVSLSSYLHLLFLVTPKEFVDQIRFNGDICFERYLALSAEDQSSANVIGITESMIMVAISGRILSKAKQQLLHHFYITLMLYDLWLQKSVWHVAEKYAVHRGLIQNLLSSSSSFGCTLVYFCEEFDDFWAYQALLPNFVKRLSFCVTADLFPLMELPAVKMGRARQLYSAGFKNIKDLARVSPSELVSRIEHMTYRVATQIISAAKMIMIEKIEALKEEAELLNSDDLHYSVIMEPEEEFLT